MSTQLGNERFVLEEEQGCLLSLVHPADEYAMNWVEGTTPWGTMRLPEGIEGKVQRTFTGRDTFEEEYTFTNTSPFHLLASLVDTAVYATFNDSYQDAATCMTRRCHAHIWCGGTSSWVMGLRMGGKPPHLGLVLTRGTLAHYSVERDLARISNDRGDFLLHPAPLDLAPGESYTLTWELFWHYGKEDFHEQLKGYDAYLPLGTTRYVLFQGEQAELCYPPGRQLAVLVNGKETKPEEPGKMLLETKAPGEMNLRFRGASTDAACRLLVLPPLWALAEARCRFITQKQQMDAPDSYLDGAYLIYDNEEGHLVCDHLNDHNAGRERVGMGLLLVCYLKQKPDTVMEHSLRRYLDFVLRTLVDEETGIVYNDAPRCDDYTRLYNAPWFARLFLECWHFWGEALWLRRMYNVMVAFYRQGGEHNYSIGITASESVQALLAAGMAHEAGELTTLYRRHGDFILKNSTHYPAHEVDYEQSIVAPAAILLLDLFKLTGEEKYLEAGKVQLMILELFNGDQPDGYLHQTAIRHWDGYWFGKRKLYGDTFPHYWSSLTGIAYKLFSGITGEKRYGEMAQASLRGVLPLLMPDGSSSSARLHPLTVNGQRGGYFDPWANDQDWGLYHMLKYGVDET